jgi:hypothetical protein
VSPIDVTAVRPLDLPPQAPFSWREPSRAATHLAGTQEGAVQVESAAVLFADIVAF